MVILPGARWVESYEKAAAGIILPAAAIAK